MHVSGTKPSCKLVMREGDQSKDSMTLDETQQEWALEAIMAQRSCNTARQYIVKWQVQCLNLCCHPPTLLILKSDCCVSGMGHQ